MRKLSRIEYDEKINIIKTYKPYYCNKNGTIVTFNVPKHLSDVRGLSELVSENIYGSIFEIKSLPQIYDFNDKENDRKKIRGWKLKMKSIKRKI